MPGQAGHDDDNCNDAKGLRETIRCSPLCVMPSIPQNIKPFLHHHPAAVRDLLHLRPGKWARWSVLETVWAANLTDIQKLVAALPSGIKHLLTGQILCRPCRIEGKLL